MSPFRGRTGSPGNQGNQGNPGEPGKDGVAGDQGDQGGRGARGKRGQRDWPQLVAFLMIAGISIVGFSAQRDQTQRLEDVVADQCVIQEQNRRALRDITQSVAQLGRGLVGPPRPGADPTRREHVLAQFSEFERRQLEKLPEKPCPAPLKENASE